MRGVKKFLCFLMLASCHRNYQFNSSILPLECTELSGEVEGALTSPAFVAAQFCNERWWDHFEDPKLSELIELSLATHPDMFIADARIRLAQEKMCLSRSTLDPHFDFNGTLSREKGSKLSSDPPPIGHAVFSEAILEIDALYQLDLWKKYRSLFYAKIDLFRASFAERKAVELLLSSSIATVYFELQAAQKRLELAKVRLDETKKLLALYTQRFQSGLAASFAVYDTDQDVAKMEELVVSLEEAIQVNFHALNALVGNPSCSCIGEIPPFKGAKVFPLPPTLPLDLLARRPEIAAQKWKIEAGLFTIRSRQAEFYPNIDLLATIGFDSIILSKLFEAKSLIAIAKAAVNLPLFDAGKRQAELGIAREEAEIEIATYNQMILKAVQEVGDWIVAIKTSDKELHLAQRATFDAQKVQRLRFQRLQGGIGDYQAVLNAQENALLRKDEEIRIELDRILAQIGLFKAIGGGYFDCI